MKQDNRNSLIPIGKMATANKVTIATLRLYDQMGLLKPAFIDPDSGYRYYTIQQTSRLDFIRYMRELGLSLADIQSILEKEDVTLIEEKLIEKNNQIHQQLRELKAMHEAVDRTIQSIERYRKSPASGMISLEFIDQRYILYAPCAVNFYETGIVAYENIIHDLRTDLMEKGLPQILSYNLGTSILLSDFEAGRFIPDQVFIFGDRHLQDYGDAIRVLCQIERRSNTYRKSILKFLISAAVNSFHQRECVVDQIIHMAILIYDGVSKGFQHFFLS